MAYRSERLNSRLFKIMETDSRGVSDSVLGKYRAGYPARATHCKDLRCRLLGDRSAKSGSARTGLRREFRVGRRAIGVESACLNRS